MRLRVESLRIASISILVFLSYALIYTVFFSATLFENKLLAIGDSFLGSVPAFYAIRSAWTDLILAGFPIAGDPQSLYFYPIVGIFEALPNGLNAFFLCGYVLASSFVFALMRTLHSSRAAAFASGIIYGLSGYMVANICHIYLVHTAAWFPLQILTLHKLHENRKPVWLIVFSISVWLAAVAGFPQIFVYEMGACAAYCLYLCAVNRVYATQFLVMAFTGVVFGCGLAAPQLLMGYALLQDNWRNALTYKDFSGGAVPLWQAINLFFPTIFGITEESIYKLPYFGPLNPQASTTYVGIVPIILAIFASSQIAQRKQLTFWMALAAVSLTLALGDSTPLNHLMFLVPGYNKFRLPSRHLIEFAFAIAVLAGYGIDSLQKNSVSKRYQALSVVSVASIMTMILALLPIYADALKSRIEQFAGPHYDLWSVFALSILVPFSILALFIALLFAYRRLGRFAMPLLLCLIAADLTSVSLFLPWHYQAPSITSLDPPPAAAICRDQLKGSGQRFLAVRGLCAALNELPLNLSELWQLESASGAETLAPGRYWKMLGITEGGFLTDQKSWIPNSDRTFDVLAVKMISLPKIAYYDEQIKSLQDSKWTKFKDLGDTYLLENKQALERTWFVKEAKVLPAESVLTTLKSSRFPNGQNFDPINCALLEESLPSNFEPTETNAKCEIIETKPGKKTFKIAESKPAFLIMSDSFYSGWQATLDGIDTHIYRTDYVLRGIACPAGEHRLVLEYKPPALAIGGLISFCSGFLLFIIAACAASPMLRNVTRTSRFRS